MTILCVTTDSQNKAETSLTLHKNGRSCLKGFDLKFHRDAVTILLYVMSCCCCCCYVNYSQVEVSVKSKYRHQQLLCGVQPFLKGKNSLASQAVPSHLQKPLFPCSQQLDTGRFYILMPCLRPLRRADHSSRGCDHKNPERGPIFPMRTTGK
jgi:hypothetical protein